MLRAEFHSSIAEIPSSIWDGIFATDFPFIRHAFLLALEETGCVGDGTGWLPRHLLFYRGEEVCAAMPLYLKSHSYGEFVFDWGWAEAYERHGLDYYPKLVSAIPFTPVSGPRIGISPSENSQAVLKAICKLLAQQAGALGASGWHLLFPDSHPGDGPSLEQQGVLGRQDVQFHWFNRDYHGFNDYLSELRSSRRKNIRRERKAVRDQGVRFEQILGTEITPDDWSGFYRCYSDTFLKHSGHPGYLNQEFFTQLLKRMPESLLLVVARRDNELVASSLFFHDSRKLYGRYWGSLTDIQYLHFEACFYQGIEFCIEKGIAEFNPGTQGEHKLLRGFEPVMTDSFHWIADQQFRGAIVTFLDSEKRNMEAYRARAATFLPFKSKSS